MGFSRQEYWSGLPFPSPRDLPDPGIKPGSPALEADALTSEPPGKPAINPKAIKFYFTCLHILIIQEFSCYLLILFSRLPLGRNISMQCEQAKHKQSARRHRLHCYKPCAYKLRKECGDADYTVINRVRINSVKMAEAQASHRPRQGV